MGGWIKYLAAAVVAVGACGCTAPFYMQWYSSSAQAFCTEELGLATDPELYGEWFGRLDRAVPR